MYTFSLILILITPTDQQRIIRYESHGYASYALCLQARQVFLEELAKRDDINGLSAELCSMKL
jgi:hypothetical protein